MPEIVGAPMPAMTMASAGFLSAAMPSPTVNSAQILDLTWAHVWLSVPPIIAAVLVSVPLGFVASRRKAIRGAIVGGAGLLYAIPSLALFVMLPLVLGTSVLSPLNVQVALAAYGVALMTRTTADAFGSVPAAASDAAKSMGYPAWRRVLGVELPLAGPVLLEKRPPDFAGYVQFRLRVQRKAYAGAVKGEAENAEALAHEIALWEEIEQCL